MRTRIAPFFYVLFFAVVVSSCKQSIQKCTDGTVQLGILPIGDISDFANMCIDDSIRFTLNDTQIIRLNRNTPTKLYSDRRYFNEVDYCKVEYLSEQQRVLYTSVQYNIQVTSDFFFPNTKQLLVAVHPNINNGNKDELFVIDLSKKATQAQLQSFTINQQTYNNVQVFISSKGGYLFTTTNYQILEIRTYDGQILTKNN